MKLKTLALEKIKPYKRNPRRNDGAVDAVAESIRQCGYCAPIVIDEAGVILAGHTRYKALQKLGWDKAQVCQVEGLSEAQKRKYRILDNKTGEIAEWDTELLEIELNGLDFEGFDFGLLEKAAQHKPSETVSVQAYERRKSADDEEAREAALSEGLDEESPEYQAFVDKFKPKKTTDDCYTPEPVYDAIADFVAVEYGIERTRFVRPFWPGGDYKAFDYAPDAVVVDNPPFSILAEIVAWYAERGIRFFLFAPTLTLFSSSSSSSCAAIPCGVQITYENGAYVNTSFLSNLEPEDVRIHTMPRLYEAVKAANDANLAETRKELPKYVYPDEVLTAAAAYRLCKYGQELVFTQAETERIGALDAQKESDASIFGSGYLLSSRAAAERAAAERAAAERAAAERAAAEHWQLSEREREIIARMDQAVRNE